MVKNMKIKWKFFLSSLVVMVVAVSAITFFVVLTMKHSSRREIESYRVEEVEKVKANLKNYVDIAYEVIQSNYRSVTDRTYLEERYQPHRILGHQ